MMKRLKLFYMRCLFLVSKPKMNIQYSTLNVQYSTGDAFSLNIEY